jgi:hypothetical protein
MVLVLAGPSIPCSPKMPADLFFVLWCSTKLHRDLPQRKLLFLDPRNGFFVRTPIFKFAIKRGFAVVSPAK